MPMPANASNKDALKEYIRENYKTSVFNTMKNHTPEDAAPTYCRKPTREPIQFREEVLAA